ncbi:MAG: threonine--tRNA ligase [bacterium]|nr:threonine--tRNA ligase [bacterium]
MKPEKASHLYNIRHSLAHMLAQAVLDLFPEAKLGTGPVTENGFYYDFDLPRTLIPEDLEILEKKMRQFVKQNQFFVRRDEPIREAKAFLKTIKQPYKIELVDKFIEQQGIKEVSFYENVRESDNKPVFVDLCEGGHVDNTKEIDPQSFKLDKISSAYWQADENKASMQRIYGVSFETAEELKAWETMMAEAKKRDHRKLGVELDLYVLSEKVGPGLPLLTPRGTVIRQELDKLSQEKHKAWGYSYVTTPNLGDLGLYRTSGHYPYYAETMFPPLKDDETEFMLRPMNCPHHIQIYDAKPRSYRELPLRLREDGLCYRYEKSGELSGLTRVRALTIDDAHIFCTPEQMGEEINRCLDLAKEMYDVFGFKDLVFTLSLRDPANKDKYVGTDENWNKAEDFLRQALKKRGMEFKEYLGEAAFYGPKIDVKARDVLGREWQLATIPQIDYNMPERFDISYIDEHGTKQRPVILHRAVYGSYERFFGLLIEHFGGAFPTWLAPVQVEVIPVAEAHRDAALDILEQLKDAGVRAELAEPDLTLGKRIRNSEGAKVPYMIVIGDKEIASGKVNARSYHSKQQVEHDREAFIGMIVAEIAERRLPE